MPSKVGSTSGEKSLAEHRKFMELVFFKYLYITTVVANGFGAFLVDTDIVFLQVRGMVIHFAF